MKKTSTSETKRIAKKTADMLPEYHLDYRKARPNRFAKQTELPVVVTIDPDLAKVFTSSEAVNKALRALVSAMPGTAATSQ